MIFSSSLKISFADVHSFFFYHFLVISFFLTSSDRQKKKSQERRRLYVDQKRLNQDRNGKLRSEHQLPPDALIIRLKKLDKSKSMPVKEGSDNNLKVYNHGFLAFVDAHTGKLICCACFIPLKSLDSDTLQKYNHLVSTVYRHGLARNIVRRNKAANMIPPEERSGQMFAIGSRSPLFTSDENAGALVWPFGAF